MTIIDSYDKLPIGKYLQVLDTCRDIPEDEIGALNAQIKRIAILADKSPNEILRLPITEYSSLVASSRFLESANTGNNPIRKEYKLGEFTLVPTTDFRKISTAQYYDFQQLVRDVEKNLVALVSVFCIPKGKEYNEDYDIVAVHQAIRDEMSVADAMSLVGFFLTSLIVSTRNLRNCCRKEIRKLPKEERQRMTERMLQAEKALAENGAGWQVLTELLKR